MSNKYKTIGVALFGLGRAGTIHLKNLLSNHRVHVLYIIEQGLGLDKAEEYVQMHHMKETKVVDCTQSQTIYSDPRIEAVIVCAPTFEHESIVKEALSHGKSVFCEKPISQEEGGTKACYEAAQKAGKPLFCSFNRRFDPSYHAMRKRALAGEIGNIQMVKTCSRDSPLPSMEYLKISGGIYHDCAVHDIDAICWLLGERPHVVYSLAHAHNSDIAAMDDVDTVAITMKFPSGAIATIDLSRHASYGYDQRVEVFGSKGMLVSENQRPTELKSFLDSGTSSDVLKFSFPQRYADSYILAMDHFLNVVEGKEELMVTMADALCVSMIASACEESYKLGKPIELKY